MDISDKIKYIRDDLLNLSQEAFAMKIGVTRVTIRNWENGISKPVVSNLLMIAMVGNVTLDYLIFDDVSEQLSLIGIDEEQYKILKDLIEYFKNRK